MREQGCASCGEEDEEGGGAWCSWLSDAVEDAGGQGLAW
eukprot:COSAG06_NODE_424_length_15925_cov_10.806079_10_plen_39_part_00